MKSDIINHQFKDDLPLGFEVVSLVDLYARSRDLLTQPHRTAFYHIIWFKTGNLTHMVDFHSFPIAEDTILFLKKNIVQVYDSSLSIEGKAILFTDTFFCRTEADVRFLKETILFNDLFTISAIRLPSPAVFPVLFDLMETEASHPPDQYQADILRGYLHDVLLHSERERRKQDFKEVRKGADLDYVLLFNDLIEAEYKTHKQVRHFASRLSVTEKRLNQATSKVLGKTAKQMIDDRILLEAKRMLAHTHDTIKEVGYTLGFEEPTNFIKYFRKHNGSTPVEFREKLTAQTSA